MFDTAARLSTSTTLRADGRIRSLPLSLALHGLAVGAVALLSIRSLPDASDPPIPLVFFEGSAPPMSSGEEGATTAKTEGVRDPTEPPRAASQREIEVSDPTRTQARDSAEDRSTSSGQDGPADSAGAAVVGDPTGPIDGNPNGLKGSNGYDGKTVGDDKRTYVPGGDVAAPRLVSRAEPPYPEIARKAHMEGVVVLQAVIDRSGNVEDLHLVKSANVLLDGAAMEAVSRWHYLPATLGGVPVRVYLTVTVEFRLR